MCNLTFVVGPSKASAMAAIYEIAVMSSSLNSHGWGTYNQGTIWRTVFAADCVSNAATCLNSAIKDAGPIMSHTRLASKGVQVLPENVHPFEFSKIVGMHNGTLYSEKFGDTPEKTVGVVEESRPSDSKKFFELLNEELNTEVDMVIALNNVMKLCRGKFAFLIYYKVTDQYFVVRGKSADLHHCDILDPKTEAHLGFIVNTNKRFLEESMIRISNLSQFLGGGALDFTKSTELKQETIYIFDTKLNNLVEVGTLNENPLPKPTPAITGSGIIEGQVLGGGGSNHLTNNSLAITTTKGGEPAAKTTFRKIADWAALEMLTVPLVNKIFMEFFGHSFISATETELKEFLEQIIPTLTSEKAVHNAGTKLFLYLLGGGFYASSGLNFPLALNKTNRALRAMYKYSKRMEDA